MSIDHTYEYTNVTVSDIRRMLAQYLSKLNGGAKVKRFKLDMSLVEDQQPDFPKGD